MNHADKKIQSLNAITKAVQDNLPDAKEFSTDSKVIALTMLRHLRFAGVRKELVKLIEIIVNETEDKNG